MSRSFEENFGRAMRAARKNGNGNGNEKPISPCDEYSSYSVWKEREIPVRAFLGNDTTFNDRPISKVLVSLKRDCSEPKEWFADVELMFASGDDSSIYTTEAGTRAKAEKLFASVRTVGDILDEPWTIGW